jgi:L-ascorbate metabolism protein UlaG (beta-lactamase superfamily)
MARITWHGHSTFTLVTDGGRRIMFDPFLADNPVSDLKVADVAELDFILCTHGHFDHFSDAVELALKTGATLVGTFELVSFAQTRGVEQVHAMNVGGGHRFDFGYVRLTPAVHTGTVAGDDQGRFTSVAHGYWLDLDGKRLYNAGDTALTMDMQLLRGRVDVALLPIGDNFTMGPDEAARAVGFIQPRTVIPMHYDTWPPIAQDPEHFRSLVGSAAEVVVLSPGGSHDF